MSEHHRAAWGSREDAVWWPSGIPPTGQQTLQLQQHLINQHHQQQLAQQQQANRFQNLVTNGVTVSTSNAPYNYQLAMSTVVARPGDPPTIASTAPSTQWWNLGGQNTLANSLQQQPQQQPEQQPQQQPQQRPQQQPQPRPQHQNQGHVQQNNAIQNKMVAGNVAGAKPKGAKRPRGRMTAYSFFTQTCREEHRKKYPEERVIFIDFSRKCAERWKAMPEKEKQRFKEMAEQDKQRYELEMQNYVPPEGTVVGRGKKRKQCKDPNAPKRSTSAFFWFCRDERNKVKALNPEYRVSDTGKALGRKWSDLDAEIKQKYEQMAEKDKQRYYQEITEYKLKCKNEQGGGTPRLNLPQQLQQAGLQHLPPPVQQVAAAQLQTHVVQAHHAAAAAAAPAVQQQDDDDDDDEEDSEEDDSE